MVPAVKTRHLHETRDKQRPPYSFRDSRYVPFLALKPKQQKAVKLKGQQVPANFVNIDLGMDRQRASLTVIRAGR